MPRLRKPNEEPPSRLREMKAQRCGLRHTVYAVNGDEYCGEWLDDKKHGKGTNIWKKGRLIYEGEWKHGMRNGFGTLSKMNPVTQDYVKLYAGGWKDNKKDGYGTYFYSKNTYYEGQWSGDMRNGWGRMYYDNGDTYNGEWLQDKPHGQGMLRLANENKYEGSWKNGKKHGAGKFFFLDKGQMYEGMWKEDTAKCGTVTDFGRQEAPDPTTYPIPKVHLLDPNSVLLEAQMWMALSEDRE